MSRQRDSSPSRLSSHKLLHEPESKRLQNDIDALTKMLGLQRRRAASLDERVQFYSKEISAKKEKLHHLVPSAKEEQRLQNKLVVLENQLLKEKVQLNKDLVDNQKIREQIDGYRRDKVSSLSIFRSMHSESETLSSEAEKTHKEKQRLEDEDRAYRHQLLQLKERAETAIGNYQSQAALMQGEIEQDRLQYRDANKSFSDKVYPDSHVFIDNNQILKALYDKWTGLCKEQKKVVDQYNKTVRYLSDAFSEIKEATGIGSINEMVTGLVKAQEQEQVLLGNLNAVMAQADALENRLRDLEEHYRNLVRTQKTTISKNEDHLNVLREELTSLRNLLQRKVEKQAKLKQEVDSLHLPIQRLLGVFRECNLPPKSVKATAEAKEADILQKIGQLEKAINFLIQYLSIGKNEGLPALFESDLSPKDFDVSATDLARNGIKGSRFEDQEFVDEVDRPLSAMEIRQHVKQKFPQLQ